LTSPAPGAMSATTLSFIHRAWCTSAERGVATSSTCDQRVGHRRPPSFRRCVAPARRAERVMCCAGAQAHTPGARREAITTEVLDTAKNRCKNRPSRSNGHISNAKHMHNSFFLCNKLHMYTVEHPKKRCKWC
jgi:hypothetical protein